MSQPDDTQPRSPFRNAPQPTPMLEPPPLDDEPMSGGPGCLLFGLVGMVILGLSGLIIALSAFAGWSSGTRIAQTSATATQYAAIQEQVGLIPADVSSGNQFMLNKRLEYLATLTPGVPGLADFQSTATAVYINNLPTATPTPSPTATTPAVTPTVQATIDTSVHATPGLALDLPALLTEAQQDVSLSDWDSAIETLDIILAADGTFESGTVRTLMLQALKTKALGLFRSSDPSNLAEAVRLTDRAREFGDIGELDYESYIATLYLDAMNTVGIDYGTSIRTLQALYNLNPTYMDVGQLLFQQYVGYGDAWAAGNEFCPAIGPYQSALTMFNDASVSAKLTNAQTMCAQATPLGGATPLPGTPQIAPIGQPGT